MISLTYIALALATAFDATALTNESRQNQHQGHGGVPGTPLKREPSKKTTPPAKSVPSDQHGGLGSAQIEGKMGAPAKVGDNIFEVSLKDSNGKPMADAKVSITVRMVEMDHGISTPTVTKKRDGLYTALVKFAMEGKWRVSVHAVFSVGQPQEKEFTFTTVGTEGMPPDHKMAEPARMQMGHEGASMKGRLGDWGMAREGSGTSWLPDDSPMFMKPLRMYGGFDVNLMGLATVNYTDAGGRRGESQLFSNSMVMLMARKASGRGVVGLNFMGSLDPLFNGKKGYPNLFQTGETDGGRPLRDRQHPHDIVAELTASYSHPLAKNARVFVYGGPVGEPALGGPMFLHRASGMEIPEAPISHHWFDATHVSFGVLTGGFSFADKWRLEGSWFNGTEPDENRYDLDPIRLDSASGRVSFNPSRNWAMQVSYGFLKEPEPGLRPGEGHHRLTASAIYSKPLPNGDHFAASVFFGQNIMAHGKSSALGIEATYYKGKMAYFGRFEQVEKDELVGVPMGKYAINKFVLGATHNIATTGGFDFGVGGYVALYAFPRTLEPFYGKAPMSFGVFLRIRPAKMQF